MNSLHDLFVRELKDLWSTENQLAKALPRLAKLAKDPTLREVLNEHAEQTKHQQERIEQIFEKIGGSPRGKKSEAMEALLSEGQEIIRDMDDVAVRDAAIICETQKVEHFEIAGYGTARTYARLLGMEDAVRLLEQTLQEEKDADSKLNRCAEQEINQKALQAAH